MGQRMIAWAQIARKLSRLSKHLAKQQIAETQTGSGSFQAFQAFQAFRAHARECACMHMRPRVFFHARIQCFSRAQGLGKLGKLGKSRMVKRKNAFPMLGKVCLSLESRP